MNWKSTRAIVAGLIFVIVVTTLVDIALVMSGVFAKEAALTDAGAALATAYRIVIGIAGAALTARLAPGSPMKHVMILGGIGMALAIVGIVATWGKAELGPQWYPIALAVLALPQSWLGGRLAAPRAEKT